MSFIFASVDTDVLHNFSKVFPTVSNQTKKGATQSQSTLVKLSSEVRIAFLVFFV